MLLQSSKNHWDLIRTYSGSKKSKILKHKNNQCFLNHLPFLGNWNLCESHNKLLELKTLEKYGLIRKKKKNRIPRLSIYQLEMIYFIYLIKQEMERTSFTIRAVTILIICLTLVAKTTSQTGLIQCYTGIQCPPSDYYIAFNLTLNVSPSQF
jgi:hypothetical protein